MFDCIYVIYYCEPEVSTINLMLYSAFYTFLCLLMQCSDLWIHSISQGQSYVSDRYLDEWLHVFARDALIVRPGLRVSADTEY